MDKIKADLIHGWRSARARSAATAATVLVLGLGTGLTAAMFALADPFLLRPLPYAQPEELVAIEVTAHRTTAAARIPTLSDWQARDDLFRDAAAYRLGTVLRLRTPVGGIALQSVDVSHNLLSVLGLPALPRSFRTDPGARELQAVLLTTAHEWLRGAAIAGQTLPRQDGGAVRFVAALPGAFLFPRRGLTPRLDALTFVANPSLIDVNAVEEHSFAASPFVVIARLREGVTPTAAEAALTATLAGSELEVTVRSLTPYLRRGMEPLALGALAAGLLVLLICVGNTANLLLARGVYRARDLATREAIGATPWDLTRLVLVELALIAAGGLACGLVLARMTLAIAASVIPLEYSALGTPEITGRVFGLACGVAAFVTIAGVIPSWMARRLSHGSVVEQAATAEGRTMRMLRFGAAAIQTALAVVLVSGVALLARSYVNLNTQSTGFDGSVRVVSVVYPPGHTGVRLQGDIDATLQRLRRVHGVIGVGAATGPMVDNLFAVQLVRVKGQPDLVQRKYVSAGYLAAVGTPIVAGRGLTPEDRRPVALVNESFARRHSPEGSIIGQQLLLGMAPFEVVGIARDTFDLALDIPPAPMVLSLLDNPTLVARVNYALQVAPRSRPSDSVLSREVTAVNADAIVIDTSSLAGRLAATVKDRTFATLILTFFAVAGIGVCISGLVGIVTFVVARRTREIAIRMAIGATASDVRRLVARDALAAAATGALVGLAAGRGLSKTLEAHLYGVAAGDWPTILMAVAPMMAIVAAAALIPAGRAVRLSPSAALRRD